MKFNQVMLLLVVIVFGSCKSPDARKPAQQTSGTFIEQSVERNKKIFEEEKAQIEDVIAANPSTEFIASDSGFWYFYNEKNIEPAAVPGFGDIITITFNVSLLDGTPVVSEKENGLQTYMVDQSNQDLIAGIRDGVKLMQVGETVTFLLPSYKAYGYYGIENKLGTNLPIQSTVTLKTIEKSEDN